MSFGLEAHWLSKFEPEQRVEDEQTISNAWLWASRATMDVVVVGTGYYVGCRLGFFLTPQSHAIATYWPANAIVMAALLLAPLRRWPLLLIAVLCAHLLAQIPRGIPVSTAMGWFATNSCEALLGAALLYRRKNEGALFASAGGILRFLLFGMFFAPFVTSFFDAAVVVITRWDADYWLIWITRFVSNSLAVLTIVPFVVIVGTRGARWVREATLVRKCELLILAGSIVSVTIVVYGAENLSPRLIPALVYVPLPFLLWACLRFGAGGLAGCGIAIALTSFHFVLQGRGPFVSTSMVENVLFLQILLMIAIVPLMLVNAVLAERGRTHDDLQRSRVQLIESQEMERSRIARELHDDIVQRLSLVGIELHQLRDISTQPLPANLAFSIRNLTRQVDSISESTRALSHGLHPVHLEVLGLGPALRGFCSELRHQTSMTIRLREQALPPQLDKSLSLAIFRVAQEGLHNVLKHSHGRNVDVQLKSEKGQIILRITDDGVGFALNGGQASGLGLVNMKDRLESVGGTLEITAGQMRGTILEARVPVEPKSARLQIDERSRRVA